MRGKSWEHLGFFIESRRILYGLKERLNHFLGDNTLSNVLLHQSMGGKNCLKPLACAIQGGRVSDLISLLDCKSIK